MKKTLTLMLVALVIGTTSTALGGPKGESKKEKKQQEITTALELIKSGKFVITRPSMRNIHFNEIELLRIDLDSIQNLNNTPEISKNGNCYVFRYNIPAQFSARDEPEDINLEFYLNQGFIRIRTHYGSKGGYTQYKSAYSYEVKQLD